jgi:hypothetical protein
MQTVVFPFWDRILGNGKLPGFQFAAGQVTGGGEISEVHFKNSLLPPDTGTGFQFWEKFYLENYSNSLIFSS